AAEDLNRIAKTCERKCEETFPGQAVEQCLPFAIMHKSRRGHSDVGEISRFISSIQVHNARRVFERQTAEKQFVYQTKDRGVQPDAEGERKRGDNCESRRFTKLAQSKANVVHIIR